NHNPTNVLIQGNSSPTTTDLYDYFAWVQGQEINLIGNTVANSIDQALIRADAEGCSDVEIAYNNLTKTSPAGQSFKNTITLQWTNYTYAYMNNLTNGHIQTGPLGDVPGSGAQSNESTT